MRSEATTVEQYLQELPEDRRIAIEAVRDVILTHLPTGYEEAVNWGMLVYQVPLDTWSDTYNGQPLMYAALASQKRHMSVYLMSVYMDNTKRDQFLRDYERTGKRLDVGKSCVRFRKLEDLPLDLIGRTIASMQLQDFVHAVERTRAARL